MNTAWFHYDEKTSLTKQRLYTARCHYEEEKGVLPNSDYCTLSLWWRKQPNKTTDYCKLSLWWREGNLTKQRLVHVVIMWKRKESYGCFIKQRLLQVVIMKKRRESYKTETTVRCHRDKENSPTKQRLPHVVIMIKRTVRQNNDYCSLPLCWREQSNKTATTARSHYDKENSPTKQRLPHVVIVIKRTVRQNNDYCTVSLW